MVLATRYPLSQTNCPQTVDVPGIIDDRRLLMIQPAELKSRSVCHVLLVMWT